MRSHLGASKGIQHTDCTGREGQGGRGGGREGGRGESEKETAGREIEKENETESERMRKRKREGKGLRREGGDFGAPLRPCWFPQRIHQIAFAVSPQRCALLSHIRQVRVSARGTIRHK